jgi:hypothetical protein
LGASHGVKPLPNSSCAELMAGCCCPNCPQSSGLFEKVSRVRKLATCRPGPQRSAAGGTVGDSPEPKTILTCHRSRKPPPAHPVRAPVATWQRYSAATWRLARHRMRLGHGGVEPMLAGSSPGRGSVRPSLSRAYYARRFGTLAAIGRGGGRSGCLPHGRWMTVSVCRKSCVPRGRQDR